MAINKDIGLPPSWTVATIEQVTLPISTIDPKGNPESRFCYLDISGIDNSTNKIVENKSYLGSDAPSRARQIVRTGDILFSTVRTYLKNIAKVPNRFDGEVASTGFSVLRPASGVNSDFLFYQTLTPSFLNPLADLQRGSSYPAVRDQDVREQFVPIAPRNEQHRIVAKIEELFSELDKGIENLKTAREQLKVYRQALLKHAFEGKLTVQWRKENKDKLETAEELLKRIQIERVECYQGELAAWEARGKQGDKPKAPKKLPSADAEELAEMPDLPAGWAWTRLGNTNVEVSDGPFGSNLKSSDYVDNGVRVIRLENIGALKFIGEKESFVTDVKYESLKRHTVSSGDIIFSSFITENIRVALLPPSVSRAINKADCFCIRFSGQTLRNVYAVMFLSTRNVYKQLESLVHGVGRPRVNTTQLKHVLVPVCGAAEQKAIIAAIESRLSEVDQLDQTISSSLHQAEALRQSILKRAFSGRLVPQDPGDEPASALLARIKAEKAARAAENESAKRTRKRA